MSENGSSHAELATQSSKTVSRSAFKVGAGNLFGLIAGFGSQMLLAALFGAGKEMDAYLTALTIPIYIQAVLLAGISFVFIPAFVKDTAEGRDEDAWALVGTFFWLIGGVLLAIALIVAIFPTFFIGLFAPGLNADKSQLAGHMLSVLIFAAPLSGYAVFTTGIQNARNQFFWPAASGALNSLVQIAVVLLLYRQLGIQALAWAFLAATAAQASVTVIPVLRHGWARLEPLRSPRVTETLRLILPFILLGLVTKITPVLQRSFASGLPDGDLSYLGYAAKTARIFQGLLGSTIVTAIFPVMARAFAREGRAGLDRTFHHGMRLTLATGMPVVAIVTALSTPMVMVLFERGAFTHADTLAIARIMPLVLLQAVLFIMVGNLLTRVFYVMKDTRTPPVVSIISIGFYFLFASVGVRYWGYVGLAAAGPFYTGIGVSLLSLLIMRRRGRYPFGRIARYLTIYGAPSVIAFGVSWIIVRLLAQMSPLLQLAIAGGVAALVYLVLIAWLDREIASDIFEMTGVSRVLRRTGLMGRITRPRLPKERVV